MSDITSPAPARSSDLPPPRQTGRRPPASFFALGCHAPPEEIQSGGRRYRRRRVFKHDFFAATGLYEEVNPHPGAGGMENAQTPLARGIDSPATAGGHSQQVVLKIQRTYPLFGFPMQWLGRLAARHETAVFRRLQGIAGIPEFLGEFGPTGYLHAFVPGRDLGPAGQPDAAFFQALFELLTMIHARHVAYVDTNKRENILQGDDGRPHLIDFQISFIARRGARDNFAARWILQRLQAEDWYHYYKHKTRLAPQICTPADFQRAGNRSWYIRLHRRIAQPVIRWRRRFLARYNNPAPGRR